MTLSREAQRRADWRRRHQIEDAPPSLATIPEQPGRPLCIVLGCVRPRQRRSQLCVPHDRETDP